MATTRLDPLIVADDHFRETKSEPLAEGLCIVCGHETPDRTQTTGRRHWRCGGGEECAVRRNAGKLRPRPEHEVRAEWRARHGL
jgi:hypothetical protein